MAIVDSKQRLVGNVSVRDLRTVLKEKPDEELQKPVSAFLLDMAQGSDQVRTRDIHALPNSSSRALP